MIGYIGVIFVLTSYVFLTFFDKVYAHVFAFLGGVLLVVYADQLPFIILNSLYCGIALIGLVREVHRELLIKYGIQNRG